MNALTPKEVKVIQMALETLMEDSKAAHRAGFNPEAKLLLKDMLETAMSALSKIQKASGYAVRLDPYKEGDEKEFLAKPHQREVGDEHDQFS